MSERLPNDYRIDALAWEASEMGISYGRLVAATSMEDRDGIAETFAKEIFPRRKKKRGKKELKEFPDFDGLFY